MKKKKKKKKERKKSDKELLLSDFLTKKNPLSIQNSPNLTGRAYRGLTGGGFLLLRIFIVAISVS